MADLIADWKPLTSTPAHRPGQRRKTGNPDGRVVYAQSEDDYLKEIPRLIRNGARVIGGCCGTTPAYIRRMAALDRGRVLDRFKTTDFRRTPIKNGM